MPVMTNQIFRVSPVLYRIFRPSSEGSWGLAIPSFDGREIVEPLEVDEATASVGAYKTSDTWTPGTTTILRGAHYPWRMYYAGIKIHNREIAENTGRERIFDIAAIRLQNVVKVLRKALITDFYGTQDDTDGSERMVGLGAMTATTGQVGGIDKAGAAYWQGNVNASGGDLTWILLNDMFYHTKKYGAGDRATLIVATEGVLQNYENMLTKVVAATTQGYPYVQMMSMARDYGKSIEGGFESFYFKRIPMVADPFCTANNAFFINERYLHWRVLKNFDTTGWMQLRDQGADWVSNYIYGYGALTSSACNKLGRFTGLTEA
jgi:hypothetical protein